MGKLDDAEADVTLALRLDAELPMSLTEPVSRAVLCEIRLDRGEVDAAREGLAVDLGRYEGVGSMRFLQAARARLHLALGEPAEALRDLSELGDRGVGELGARAELAPHWPPLAVRALLAAGERGEALSLAEKDVRMTRAFGAPAATSAALVGARVVPGRSRSGDRPAGGGGRRGAAVGVPGGPARGAGRAGRRPAPSGTPSRGARAAARRDRPRRPHRRRRVRRPGAGRAARHRRAAPARSASAGPRR